MAVTPLVYYGICGYLRKNKKPDIDIKEKRNILRYLINEKRV